MEGGVNSELAVRHNGTPLNLQIEQGVCVKRSILFSTTL